MSFRTQRSSLTGFLAKPIVQFAVLLFGLLVLILRIHRAWLLSPYSTDDFGQVYLSASLIVHGQSPYNHLTAIAEMPRYLPGAVAKWHGDMGPNFYPPSAALIALPLIFVNYEVAKVVWFILSFVFYVGCGFLLLRTVFPRLAWPYAAALASFSVIDTHFGLALLCRQLAPVLTGLMCLFFVCELRLKQGGGFVCALIIVCLKVTAGLPFFCLYLLQKRYRDFLGLGAAFLILNGIGFGMIGGLPAVQQYRQSTLLLDTRPENSLNPRSPDNLERTDIPYLVMGFHDNIPAARAIGLVFNLAALGLIAALGLPLMKKVSREKVSRETAILALSGPLLVLTLLCTYHHRYDLTLLIAPTILYAALISTLHPRWPAIGFVCGSILLGLYDSDRITDWLMHAHIDPQYIPKLVVSAALLVLFALSTTTLRLIVRNADDLDKIMIPTELGPV